MSKKNYKHRRLGGRSSKMRLAHHVLWEEVNGPIPDGYILHHIDEDKQNNDIENLQLVVFKEHQRIHSSYFWKINGQWVGFCKHCNELNDAKIGVICNSCCARKARMYRRKKKYEQKKD